MPSQEDLAFGQIAVEKKFCTAAQVAECLELQAKERELGVLPKSLSELLMEGGHLSQYLVKEIYKLQGKQEGFPEIEGYVVEAKIGHGGMGTVYRAMQKSLERVVAIKVLASNLARDREFVNRFMREARSVARLSHENIIVGIDVGVSNGHHFFAMEYVDGLTVHDILRMDGPMDETRAIEIVRQIALALAHANEHSLVHRDVKPGNIMVIADGMAKLCDLGLAKSIHQDNHLTHTGTTHGTPHYMSPEQARGSADIDIRSDIYSLGATLYQMVVGEVPFTGASAAVVLLKHLSETVPSPRHRRVNLSDGVCHLIEKMMAKRVEHRYQTPRELLADIDAVLAGEPPVSERPEVGQSSVMPASAPPEASTSITDTPSDVVVDLGPEPVAPLNYKPVLLAAGSVAVGAVIMLVGMQLFGGNGSPGGPGENTSVSAATSVVPPATAVTPVPPVGPDPAQVAIETQAKAWLAELDRNVQRYPDDFREHLHACDVLMKQFPNTLTAQKVRGIRSDLKARWHAAARAALAAAIADHDALLRDDAFGEAIARVQEVADEFADTPAGTDAANQLRDLQGGRVERLADIRRAANESEDEGDYALAIEHWKRALKLGDPDISGEAKLQIERLEGLRRFAEAAAAERAKRIARSHLHNFVHTMLEQTLVTRRHREALAGLREFAATAEVAPLSARVQREVEWVQRAAEAFDAAETALSEQTGKVVALRQRGVTDRLISGTLQRIAEGSCRIKLGGTAGAVVTIALRDLAVEDILRLGGADTETGEGRWIESAVRYCDNDLPGARNALAAAGEAGLTIEQRRIDLQELVAWRLLQEARRHWIAERYREAGGALERMQRRHGETEVFTDHADEINGRAVLAPSYEERAEAVKLLSGDGAAKVFGTVAAITAVDSQAGPPHLGFAMDRLTFTVPHKPNWFLMDGDNEAELWARTANGTSGADGTRLLLEPRMSGEAPLRVRLEFRTAKPPAGTLLTLAEPFPGQAGKHRSVRFIVGDGGAVLIVQERPLEGRPVDLLRIDDLKLGSEGLHSIDVTLGEGRISVAVDGRATRSAAAGPRPGGHVVLDGHGAGLNYVSLSVSGRLDPPWVLNDPKVRRLLTVGR